MHFKGFDRADFDLFSIPGLEERMEALKGGLRQKFVVFGEELKEELSAIAGEDMRPHVAKHARRKTNPPDDSWVAFASSERGYKMLPHFQICVWGTHVLIQWGLIYEAKAKEKFAGALESRLEEIKREIPSHFQWFKHHLKPEGLSHASLSDEDFRHFAHRLRLNPKGELMAGLSIPREEALAMSPDQFYQTALETWKTLAFLHNLAR